MHVNCKNFHSHREKKLSEQRVDSELASDKSSAQQGADQHWKLWCCWRTLTEELGGSVFRGITLPCHPHDAQVDQIPLHRG